MRKLGGILWVLLVLCSSAPAFAGPAEEADATVQRWSAAFNSNDPETIAKLYAPDALLLGTVSPVMSQGTEGVLKYFAATKGTGNKN